MSCLEQQQGATEHLMPLFTSLWQLICNKLNMRVCSSKPMLHGHAGVGSRRSKSAFPV